MRTATLALSLLVAVATPASAGVLVYDNGAVNTLNFVVSEDTVEVLNSTGGLATTLNVVSGGGVQTSATVRGTSLLNLNGGFAETIYALDRSTVTINPRVPIGPLTNRVLVADNSSTVNIRGGDIPLALFDLTARGNSRLSIVGAEASRVAAEGSANVSANGVTIDRFVASGSARLDVGSALGHNSIRTVTVGASGNSVVNLSGVNVGSLFFGPGLDVSGAANVRWDGIRTAIPNPSVVVNEDGVLTIVGMDWNYSLGPILDTSGTITGRVRRTDTPGGTSPISITFQRSGNGQIILAGTSAAVVPAPPGLVLAAAGALCLVACRLRRAVRGVTDTRRGLDQKG